MFKALNLDSRQEVIILDPKWARQVAALRLLDQRDRLVCPWCEQPVRVRAGNRYRWHFAHKHLQNCPFESESPVLLACRALLYGWLVAQFGPQAVTLEKRLEAVELPRPADCWVETERLAVAYWIIETRLKPEAREALKEGFRKAGCLVQYVFVDAIRRVHALEADALSLTTTEREFQQRTKYDLGLTGTFEEPGASLHYLDPEQASLTTYRGLHRIHRPQIYAGQKLSSPLNLVAASPTSGEFIHPEDEARLALLRQAKSEHDRMLQEARKVFLRRRPPPVETVGESLWAPHTPDAPPQDPHSAPSHPGDPFQNEEATCMLCGQITREWWYLNRATHLCKCRECLEAGRV